MWLIRRQVADDPRHTLFYFSADDFSVLARENKSKVCLRMRMGRGSKTSREKRIASGDRREIPLVQNLVSHSEEGFT